MTPSKGNKEGEKIGWDEKVRMKRPKQNSRKI